jgi:hypothetical protein
MHLQGGVDILTVSKWLGHKELKTTMRYLTAARGEDVRKKVNEGLLASAFAPANQAARIGRSIGLCSVVCRDSGSVLASTVCNRDLHYKEPRGRRKRSPRHIPQSVHCVEGLPVAIGVLYMAYANRHQFYSDVTAT